MIFKEEFKEEIFQCICCGLGDKINDGGKFIEQPIYGKVFYCEICINRGHYQHEDLIE